MDVFAKCVEGGRAAVGVGGGDDVDGGLGVGDVAGWGIGVGVISGGVDGRSACLVRGGEV